MFIRTKFVTNSSTTSYLVYGLQITDNEIDQLASYLQKQDPERFLKLLVERTDTEKEVLEEELKAGDTARDLIYDNYDFQEFIGKLLPADIAIEVNEYESYLHINKAFDTELRPDGQVVLTKVTAEHYKELLKLAKEIGAKDQTIGFVHWAVADH